MFRRCSPEARARSRALADLGAHIELECEELDQPLHDGESQTITIARDIGRNTDLIELIVDVRQLIRRNADARIEHLDADQAPPRAGSANVPSLRRCI